MIRNAIVFLAFAAAATFCRAAPEDRWVWMACSFWGRNGDANSLEHFTNVVGRAAEAGYNAVVLSSHFDLSFSWPETLLNRVLAAKAFCDSAGMEIVPVVWDVGYGGDCPANWLESRTIEDLPYVRRGGKAVFAPDPVEVKGGATDRICAEGTGSSAMPMRLSRRFAMRKGTRYVVTARVRSTGVPDEDLFQFIGFIPSVTGRSAYYHSAKFPHDGRWHDVVCPLEAKSDEEVSMLFGHWGDRGRLEIEDFKVSERGICGVTRRERIPFTVKDAVNGAVYEEGRDYAEVPPLTERGEGSPTGPWLELNIPANSRIEEGARLLVTADIPNMFRTPRRAQYAACMSNPEWYRRAMRSARAVEGLIRPKKWFLCFDELRSANTCAACRSRGLDMAHLIGDCLTRQREIVRRVNPSAVCYVWGDMLDPNQNAREGYANTVGSYEGVADCIPKDLVVCAWHGEKAFEQADYWASRGFRMVAGGYYDDKAHVNDRRWLEAERRHPGFFTGFMYATWRNDFSELENFAGLMFGAERRDR